MLGIHQNSGNMFQIVFDIIMQSQNVLSFSGIIRYYSNNGSNALLVCFSSKVLH